MDPISDKRKRFELLMGQAGIPAEAAAAYFAGAYIDQVETSRANREWTIRLSAEKLIPLEVYRSFTGRLREAFAHIAAIGFVIRYADEVKPEAIIGEYWELAKEWMVRSRISANGWIKHVGAAAEGRVVTVFLLDKVGLEVAKKKSLDQRVRQFYHDAFALDVTVRLSLSEAGSEQFSRFNRLVREEAATLTRDMTMAPIQPQPPQQSQPSLQPRRPEPQLPHQSRDKQSAPAADLKRIAGRSITDVPVPLQEIKEEEPQITVQGQIFGLQTKELKTGSTLFLFNITDYTDSIRVKLFAKTKEDKQTYSLLEDGKWVLMRGKAEYDRFSQPAELMVVPFDMCEVAPPPERTDNAGSKRVEFHLHTSMSSMDGITPAEQYIKMAAKWGHKAIAVTDHGNVQSFPEASKAGKKYGIKIIYGVEANVVGDDVPIVANPADAVLAEATYVVFDIETTGLSVTADKIIEIAAVKMREGKVIDKFASFVDPRQSIPHAISQLTNITDDMVRGQPEIAAVLPGFAEFARDSVLVAHNAGFDMGFLQANLKSCGMEQLSHPVLDTLELSRLLYPSLKNHRLNTLAGKFKVGLDHHHRAVDDAEALGHVLFHMIKDAEERHIVNLNQLNDYTGRQWRHSRPFHCCIYATGGIGKKNLYKLISLSHTEFFHKVPCIPKSKLAELREGLLVVSGCDKGELFEAALHKTAEEAERKAQFYDVLEIQPIDVYMHLVEKELARGREELERAVRRICDIGAKLNKPVIATGNVHYLHPRDKLCREITIQGITGFSPLKELRQPDVHFRTTEEMLQAFQFLGEEKAYEVVVENTNRLADLFEEIQLFPKKLFSPIIEGAEREIEDKCRERAKRLYGNPLPKLISERLDRELKPIIENGFSANILISERLVRKSNEDGYLVGSRGSVGSLFVANMLGISEVNPLPPHYLCGSCKHSEFFTDGSVASGFDLPGKLCPVCGDLMLGEGQDIPCETFMGFTGEKVPDIDLNFSGEYQPRAHHFTKEMFGEQHVFRAGTIGTVAGKTAFGFVKKYEELKGIAWRAAEAARLAEGCTGVKRSTGQHPGGIVVVPDYIEIEEITPVQYPADDTGSEWKTTHFDYHAFDENLLKLDILGHTDPTMMKLLHELTGVDPLRIPMNDPKVLSLFHSTEAMGVTPEQIRTAVGTYGLPDFGSRFTRQMLSETKPSAFSDLLQISGLSHGTGVWLGNAQELIRQGVCTIKTVIGCRDNIMLYLIYRGMDAALAFQITESVRKGKGLTGEWIEAMKRHDVPDWYIDSCEKIEYMFPRAHAAAYCTSAVRTAYYKLYHPIEFYAASFTVDGGDNFDIELCRRGYDAILKKYDEIEAKGMQAAPKEKSMLSLLELALEMTARGFTFKPLQLYRSDADRFIIDGASIIPPFSAVQGIGGGAAKQIAAAAGEGRFLSVEDFRQRTKASKSVVDTLSSMGCFRDLPDSNQLSLF